MKERPKSAINVQHNLFGSFHKSTAREPQTTSKPTKKSRKPYGKGKDPTTDHLKTLLLMQQ